MHDGAIVKKHFDALLAGAPLVAQQVIDATVVRLRGADPPDRADALEGLKALQGQQLTLATVFGQHIRGQMAGSREQGSAVAAPHKASIQPDDLFWVDGPQAAQDIEVSRALNLIELKAEWMLRELRELTAPLFDDGAGRFENRPDQPSAYAVALIRVANGLKMSAAARALFMRHASFAMAEVLRDVYGDANRRLKGWGVQPGAGQALPTVRAGATLEVDVGRPGALLTLRDLLARQNGLPHESTDPPPQASAQAQALWTPELLRRLFAQIMADAAIGSTAKALIGRLQGTLLRVALHDPAMLMSAHHPTWGLIDRVAAESEDHPPHRDPQGAAFLDVVEPWIERLTLAEAPDAALFEQALDEVRAFIDQADRDQLCRADLAVVALAEVEQAQRRRRGEAGRSTGSAAQGPSPRPSREAGPARRLAMAQASGASRAWRTWGDEVEASDRLNQAAQLSSSASNIPEPLPACAPALPATPNEARAMAAAQRWLRTLEPGARCRLFVQGRWLTAHLLWRSPQGDFCLFSSPLADGLHAMTRQALQCLRIEGLATTFVELSLTQRAVDGVLRHLGAA